MSWLRKLVKYLSIAVLVSVIGGALIVGGTYLHFRSELPSIENLKEIQLQIPLRVYSADNKLIAQYGEKRRDPVTYDEIPPILVKAFLAAEDQHFFRHYGIDPVGLGRAAVTLALTGKKRQGGSTITMQVARNFYLSRERTFTRKIREIFLALHIEQQLSKEEILELYLNKIYLGHRAYGIKAASQVYYGKPLEELSLAQAAMIAGLPKAPSRYNPVTNAARAKIRRNYVLGRMQRLGYITPDQANEATAQPVTARLHAADIELEAPYLAEMVREALVAQYGEETYTGGFSVHTTVSSRLQLAANQALRNALEAYDQRHGWRGAEKHFDSLPDSDAGLDQLLSAYRPVATLIPAIVTETTGKTAEVYLGNGRRRQLNWEGLSWARRFISVNKRGPKPKTSSDILRPGDLVRVLAKSDEEGKASWRLAQIPEVSGALVALDPRNGAVLAITGGHDYFSSKFNRATQAKRQPGSGFKAVIYSAALEAGYTPASIINDAPVVLEDDGSGDSWRPENYSGKFFGPTRLRWALTKSRNLISIRLLRAMGIEHTLQHAARFGFDPEQLPQGLSLALGSGEVTPIQMARAYAVLANGGYLINPWFIQRIDRNDDNLFEAAPLIAGECADCNQAPRTLPEDNRYIMYSMLQDVITQGTGVRARVLKRKDLAGKTGTTNDQRDGWFNGFNQHLVAVAWVGFDDNRKLGRKETGGRVALPAWIDFMKVALEEIPDDPPAMPPSLVTVRIDKSTGLQVAGNTSNSMFEVFRPGTEPPMAESGPAASPGEEPQPGQARAVSPEELF